MGYTEVFLNATAFRLGDFYLCKGYAATSNSHRKCLCASSHDSDKCWEHVKLAFHTHVKSKWKNFCHGFNKKTGGLILPLCRKRKSYLVNSTFSCFHKTALKINYCFSFTKAANNILTWCSCVAFSLPYCLLLLLTYFSRCSCSLQNTGIPLLTFYLFLI